MVTSRRMRRVELAPAAMAANRAAQRHNMLRLSRYTHRIAISNRRLISAEGNGITFRYKDYRSTGRPGSMALAFGLGGGVGIGGDQHKFA